MPFRKAHHVTAQIVKVAATKGCDLSELDIKEMQKIEPAITASVKNVLSVVDSVKSRTSPGGTSPLRVREAVRAAKEKLK